MNPMVEEILRSARALFRPGDLVEIRVPQARPGVLSGYFADLEQLAQAAASLERFKYPGLYWTLNPVAPDLVARADHNLKSRARDTTTDKDILERRWLPLDFDPERPTGISSTDDEKQAALEVADQAEAWLTSLGWPSPLRADSGNGWHRAYSISLPNDAESAELAPRVLQALAARFDTPRVKVDVKVANAARIFKIWGTWSRKGDSTKDRPHRQSRLLYVPEPPQVVPVELLQRVAAMVPTPIFNGTIRPRPYVPRASEPFDVQRFLDRFGVHYRGPVSDPRGKKWVLAECPFDGSHKDPDAAVFELNDGSYGFHCFHNSCDGRTWRDFREFYEPDAPRGPRPPAARSAPVRAPEAARPEEPAVEELPLGESDVEAAIDAAIESNDLLAAIRLAPDVGRQRAVVQELLLAKLRLHFKGDFKEPGYRRAMREAPDGDGTGQPQEPPAAAGGAGEGEPPAGPVDLLGFELTEAGNGERMAKLFGHEVRYCNEWKRWLVWDGKRWAPDEYDHMRQKGKQMARLLYAQAAGLPDSSFRKAVEKHARASESYAAITNALGQAASEPGIRVSALDLDGHSNLLNCANGLVDLRTGKLMPHRVKDDPSHEKRIQRLLITKLCPVEYKPAAMAPVWQGFVEWAMGAKNPEAELPDTVTRLVGFLQRALGYGLTGDVSEKVVFVFYGEGGNNGKTTLLNQIREVLGRDYGSMLLIDTILAAKTTDTTTRADLADLRGARFVQTSEVGKEDRLNAQRIKYLTQGMGWIKSRRLYENLVEFEATHKLYVDTNYRPNVREADEATWRRLKLVPFLVTVEDDKKDLQFSEKLRAEQPGILAWLVRGAMEWHKGGLGQPPEVTSAVEDWRAHDDPLRDFLDDCCVFGEQMMTPVEEMRAAYEWWGKKNGEKYLLSRQSFNDWCEKKKLRQDRPRIGGRQVRSWVGIDLKPEVTSSLHQQSGGHRLSFDN